MQRWCMLRLTYWVDCSIVVRLPMNVFKHSNPAKEMYWVLEHTREHRHPDRRDTNASRKRKKKKLRLYLKKLPLCENRSAAHDTLQGKQASKMDTKHTTTGSKKSEHGCFLYLKKLALGQDGLAAHEPLPRKHVGYKTRQGASPSTGRACLLIGSPARMCIGSFLEDQYSSTSDPHGGNRGGSSSHP